MHSIRQTNKSHLPPQSGYPTADTAQEAAAGRVAVEGLRGRSCHSPAGQIAEVTVRRLLAEASEHPSVQDLTMQELTAEELAAQEVGALGLSATDLPEGLVAARVLHADGRTWVVAARRVALEPRPASCGKAPAPAESWQVTAIKEQ